MFDITLSGKLKIYLMTSETMLNHHPLGLGDCEVLSGVTVEGTITTRQLLYCS